MRYACGVNESAHDLAAIVDPTGNSSSRSREIDLGVDAVIQVKAMRLLDSFSEDANNLATIINPISLGLRGVWEIYWVNTPLFKRKPWNRSPRSLK